MSIDDIMTDEFDDIVVSGGSDNKEEDFDDVEEITEYEDGDEEDADEDEEYEDDEDEEYEDDEEELDDEDEEYEDDEAYEDKFEQILSELKNLNTNLSQNKGNSETTVPYTDPYVNSEMSRMRDEVMKNNIGQSLQQNNTVLGEISKMREDINKTSNQNMQMELIKLRGDMQNGRGNSTNGNGGGGLYDFYLQTELAKMREEMTKTSMSSMNVEMARLREEMSSRTLKDEMSRQMDELRRQMRDKEIADRIKEQEVKKSAVPSGELDDVRNQMTKLRQEITEALSSNVRSSHVVAEEVRHVGGNGIERENAMAVLDEIKRLREDVAKDQERSKEELSRKIDSVTKKSEDEERRSREILNAISKMFISSSRELKGLTYKNQEIANSFQDAIKGNLKELQEVRGEMSKIKVSPLSDFEDVARRSNREVVSEIGSQLGALAKDIICKVDNKDEQESLYKQLANIKSEIQKSSEISDERIKKHEDILKNIAVIQNERSKKQEDILRGFTDVQTERIKRQEELLSSISDIMGKNNSMMDSILSETKRSMEIAAKGHQLTGNQFTQLKETIKAVTLRQLGELNGLKQALGKLEGTGDQIAQVDKKIMTVYTDVNKAIDALSTDMKRGISDISDYSYADKLVDAIKNEINSATSEALSTSFKGIKGDIRYEVSNVVGDSARDIIDRLDMNEGRITKAIDNMHIDGLDKMIAEIKQAVTDNGVTSRDFIKELSEKVDNSVEVNANIRRDIANLTKELQKGQERSSQLVAGLAKRMIQEFASTKTLSDKTISIVREDVKSAFSQSVQRIEDTKKAMLEANPKADIISFVGSKMDIVYSGIDKSIADIGKQIMSVVDSDRDVEIIKRSLDKVAYEIKNEISGKLDTSIGDLNRTVVSINDSFSDGINRVNGAVESINYSFDDNIGKMNNLFTDSMQKVNTGFETGIERVNSAVANMSKNVNESTEGMKMILSGIAKRMVKEFDENKQLSSRVLASVKKDIETAYSGTIKEFEEYKTALLQMDRSQEMMDIIGVKLEKVSGKIEESIDKIKQEILFSTSSKSDINQLMASLDGMASDIRGELTRGINLQNQVSVTLSEQLSALSETVERNSEKQVESVLSLVAEKVNELIKQINGLNIMSLKSDLSRSMNVHETNIINTLNDKVNEKLGRQEQTLLTAFSEQIKDIRTSLVDVIGQNDIIENIAKNVRDVKNDLSGELKKLDNGDLVQELISQLNLLSEYMLQSGRQGLDDKTELLEKIAGIKLDLDVATSNKDIDGIRKEMSEIRDRIEDSKVSDSVLVSLIEQVNAIDENLRFVRDLGSENDEIMSSLTELSSRLAKLNASVDVIKEKDIKLPKVSDESRIRAANIISDKLNEIRNAILSAVASGGHKEDALRFADTLGMITAEIDKQNSGKN